MSTSPPPAAPVAALPVELIEGIVDSIASHRDSLLCCSLLSKTWRAPAVHHLFRLVELKSPRGVEALAEVLQANPALVSYIREANIGCAVHLLSIPLPSLRNVEGLVMISAHLICEQLEGSIGWAAATFPRISRLALVKSEMCSHHDMPMKLLSAFPRLCDVYLGDNSYAMCKMLPVDRPIGICRLQQLQLHNESSTMLRSFANLDSNAITALEHFVYHQGARRSRNQESAYGRYANFLSDILTLATSLRTLHLGADSLGIVSFLLQRIVERASLRAHASLRTIEISCNSRNDNPLTLLRLVRIIRTMHRCLLHSKNFTLSILDIGPSWTQVLEVLVPLFSLEHTTAELVLRLGNEAFTISSLDSLEHILEGLIQT